MNFPDLVGCLAHRFAPSAVEPVSVDSILKLIHLNSLQYSYNLDKKKKSLFVAKNFLLKNRAKNSTFPH